MTIGVQAAYIWRLVIYRRDFAGRRRAAARCERLGGRGAAEVGVAWRARCGGGGQARRGRPAAQGEGAAGRGGAALVIYSAERIGAVQAARGGL
jgi:hypothetical protein